MSSCATKIRRQVRERREYIYKKALESQERQTYDRKQKLKEALKTGQQLPTELRKDASKLGKDLAFDEAQEGRVTLPYCLPWLKKRFAEPTTHVDDEYARAGITDPKIIITTSRDPSSKLLQFSKVP